MAASSRTSSSWLPAPTAGPNGVVLDHNLEQGNPPDAPQLSPASERVIKRSGRKPRTATADRAYGENSVDDALRELGIRYVGSVDALRARRGSRARAARRDTNQVDGLAPPGPRAAGGGDALVAGGVGTAVSSSGT